MPQATRVYDMRQHVAVNTHLHQPGQYVEDLTKTRDAIAYIQAQHCRESMVVAARSQTIIDGGSKINMFAYPSKTPAENVADFKAMIQRHPGKVSTIEGCNEVDLWPFEHEGLTGMDAAIAYQDDLYDACKADPVVSQVPLLNFTIGVGEPRYKGKHDIGNIHAYRDSGGSPASGFQWYVDWMRTVIPAPTPFMVTETGYYTLVPHDDWEGVDERTQAAHSLNTIFRFDAMGGSRCFFYQLLDQYNPGEGVNSREEHFGLFKRDWTPKQAAVALKNLMTVMSDTGATAQTFTPASMTYTLGGTATSLASKLLQKSNGNFLVVVWAEPDIWDQTANVAISRPITPITVTLDKAYPTLNVYDPMVGTNVTKTASNTGSISLDVRDHPLLLEVVNTTSTPAPGTNTQTIGTGSDSLVLKINQDAHQGNATYTVKVDGVQIGGTLTAAALRSSNQHDTITVLGNWASGSHTVDITFLP